MKKVEAMEVIGYSFDVIAMWGNDMGAFMAIGQRQFIERLAERLECTPKFAQSLYVAMVNHGYLQRFEEDNASDWLVCTTKKADESYHNFINQYDEAK